MMRRVIIITMGGKNDMDFIIEMAIYLLFAVGIALVQWCIRHKEITYAMIIVVLMIIDVFVWLKLHGRI